MKRFWADFFCPAAVIFVYIWRFTYVSCIYYKKYGSKRKIDDNIEFYPRTENMVCLIIPAGYKN